MMQNLKILFFVFLTLSLTNSQTCLTDPGCQTCSFYYFFNMMSMYGYFQCDQCRPNYQLNTTSTLCECQSGYYKTDPNSTSCLQCGPLCVTCTSSTTCTTCKVQYNRALTANGECLCVDGYESTDGGLLCAKKTNVLMIVLSSVGSIVFCVVFWIVGYRCYMYRGRKDQQIYDISGGHITRNHHAVEIYLQNEHYLAGNGGSPASLWNSKEYSYKSGQLCSICLDTDPFFMTDCGHYFHSKCIYSWLETRTACPNCNKETESKDLKRWCSGCKAVLMPVIFGVNLKKSRGGKRDLVKSLPVDQQLCDGCESRPVAVEGKQLFN